MNDGSTAQSWSEPVGRDALLPRFAAARVAPQLRGLLEQPPRWLKWALYDRRPLLNCSLVRNGRSFIPSAASSIPARKQAICCANS